MRVLAFDLGGTRLKAGLVVDGRIDRVHTTSAPANGTPDALKEALAPTAREVLRDEACDGVGLCIPGLVDERGVVVSLPGKHAGIESIDLPAIMHELFGMRGLVVNDAIAYAIGEATAGAGRGFDRVVVATIGTGVGVTAIECGAPVSSGVVGGGILGGFIPISERTEGPLDSIGRPDTIEARCAAPRIAEACGTASVKEAYAAIARGDEGARDGLVTYQGDLARALAALASAHAPDCVVLGGGPMTAGNPVTPGLEDAINARMFGSYRVSLRLAQLGDAAALAGLASLVERDKHTGKTT